MGLAGGRGGGAPWKLDVEISMIIFLANLQIKV